MDMDHNVKSKHRRVEQMFASNILDDRISNLPDDLIVHILSFLKTKDTIPTGVLSTRWKSLWKKVHHLTFDDKEHGNGFSNHVTSALISYNNPVFACLTIRMSYKCDPIDLVIWLGIAFLQKLSKLVLMINEVTETFVFPERLLGRTNTLKILKLMGNIKFDIEFACVALGCLKELHLYNVTFENEGSVTYLLDGCPRLDILVVDIFLSSGVNTFNINVSSLTRLTLGTYNCLVETIVIQTPRLQYLNIKNFDGVESFSMHNVADLKEATITRHDDMINEDILASITSVESLSLYGPFQQPMNISFNALTALDIDTKADGWCNLLCYMLKRSPHLRTLKLLGGWYSRWGTTWIEPSNVPSCLESKLHTLHWDEFVWDGKDEKRVATYLLKNASQLRIATFTTLVPITASGLEKMHRRLNHIANVRRASSTCQFVWKGSPLCRRKCMTDEDPDTKGFCY